MHTRACLDCHDPTCTDPDPILLRDTAWHCRCLNPPPLAAPPGNWFCPTCASHSFPAPTAALAAAARTSTRCPHCAAPTKNVHLSLFECPFYNAQRTHHTLLFPVTCILAGTTQHHSHSRLPQCCSCRDMAGLNLTDGMRLRQLAMCPISLMSSSSQLARS